MNYYMINVNIIMNYLEIIYKFNLVISLIFEGDIFWDFIKYLYVFY